MPLDFPDAPSPGQVYGQWTWNGIAWVSFRLGSGTYPVGGVLFGLADGNAGSDPDNLLFNPATGSLAVGGALSLGTALAIASGGTNAITAAAALSNLGGLAKAGGAMSGVLTLFGAPSADLDATTKYYVDNSPNRTITLSGAVSGSGTSTIATTLSSTVPVASGGTGATAAAAALTNLGALPITGGTMTGALQVTSNVSAFNYLIANQLTTDVGAFGFANTNGPVMVAWGNAATGAGSLIFQTVSAGGVSVQAAIMDRSQNFQIFGPTATKPSGGSWVAPSDRSLKSTVEDWHTGLQAVLALAPKTYRYNNEQWNLADTDYIGLDAEDAAVVIPEMGRTISIPGNTPEDQSIDNVDAIDSGPLLYALVNAVKELHTDIEALKAALPSGMQPLPGPQ